MIYCIYHSADLDGVCSGSIVKYALPSTTLIGIDYGQKLDLLQFHKEDEVYMVDFSLPHPQMIELSNRCKLAWIDHHKSSLKIDLSKFTGLALISNLTKAACELTWEYFFDQPLPEAVELLGRYDVWDHSNEFVLPFQYGMRSIDTEVGSSFWASLFQDDVSSKSEIDAIIERGNVVLDYINIQNERLCKTSAFEVKFEGLPFVALNSPGVSSTTFKSLEEYYDNFIGFSYDGEKWRFSLRSTVNDMSALAEKYGGGGHPGAAGFAASSISFERGKLYVE